MIFGKIIIQIIHSFSGILREEPTSFPGSLHRDPGNEVGKELEKAKLFSKGKQVQMKLF